MYTKAVNTKRCLGYVIKTYLRTRLQRCITIAIGYGNNWVISIPAPCLCEYSAWTRVRWNVVAVVGNMARHFPRKLTGNGRITFSLREVVSLQSFDWYWESFLWSMSAQKKVTEFKQIVVFLSTLLSVNLSTASPVTVNSMPSISKETVFFFFHFFTHYLGVNPQDILSGAKLSKVLSCNTIEHCWLQLLSTLPLTGLIVLPIYSG